MKRVGLLLLLPLFACGGSAGSTAPTLSGLTVETSSVTRGMVYQGTVNIADLEGLEGLKLELAFAGPTPNTSTVDVGGATKAMTNATVPFVFGLTPAVTAGSYTLGLTAIDGGALRSNTLSASLEVH
ncbi:MAG: hypothetical protein U1E65_15710 [Myxococcota bacterium]